MKKFIVLTGILILCIFTLIACKENSDENTEFNPNYAINDVKNTSEDSTEYSETVSENGDFILSDDLYYYSDNEDTNTTNNITFSYPTELDSGYYINGVRFAETIPFGFVLNDVSANIIQGKDVITNESNSNKIFCQGYSNDLKLVDTDILSTTDYTLSRLSLVANAVDYIQLGEYQYELNELLYNTDNFEDMIIMYSNNYDIVIPTDNEGNQIEYSINDIYSYAVESEGNYFGKAYTWTFSWSTDEEYTAEDLEIINNKYSELPINIITIYADYDSNDNLVYYTFKIKKASHIVIEEILITEPVIEIVTNEDGTITENIISENKIPSGQYTCSQDGYYFTDAYIKTIDDSYVGLDRIEIIIHNHNSSANKNKTFDYIIE